MSLSDRQIFTFNLSDLDWESCTLAMIPGLRVYLAKDPLSTIEQGKAKYRK